MNYLICEIYQQLNSQEDLLIGQEGASYIPAKTYVIFPFYMICILSTILALLACGACYCVLAQGLLNTDMKSSI